MKSTAQIYDYSIGIGQTVIALVSGGFYKLLAASGHVTISREGGSSIGPLLPGQGEREPFNRLQITNTSGVVNNIRILVADESFVDTRIYGSVEVIDGGRATTMAGNAFAGVASQAAVAAQFSHVQLWNPIGSGRNVAVSRVMVGTNTPTPIFAARLFNTALATLVATGLNKRAAGPASVMELRTESTVALLGGGSFQFAWGAQATPLILETKEPVILLPGWGLLITNQILNAIVGATFDYTEFVP